MSAQLVLWEAIAEATAHLSLRKASSDAGFDEIAIREFMRAINAHPLLVAHARVFENVGLLLTRIQTGAVGQLGDWQKHLKEWIQFCEWTVLNRNALTRLPGLHRLDEAPKHAADNPHLGEGVGRHAVVAAMWCCHQSVKGYPPAINQNAAVRYFNLQAHLLCSYVDARWVWVKLDIYETSKSAKEWPIAPAPTAAISRAVREFSHTIYDRFLSDLPTELQGNDFFKYLQNFTPGGDDLPDENRHRAASYLIHMKRYFKAAASVQSGLRPRIRRRAGGGGGPGSRGWIPGFITVHGTELLTVRDDQSNYQDEEEWPTVGTVYWGMPSDENEDTKALEISGLSPAEDLEPMMELLDAGDYVKAMHQIYYAQLAKEMAAQSYTWDWQHLTRGEMRRLWNRLELDIEAANQNPSNKSIARYKRITALLIKLMLLYGQSFDRAHGLMIKWIPPGTDFSCTDVDDDIDGMVVFASGDSTNRSPAETVLGIGLPALSPTYKTDLDENLDDLSRVKTSGLVLPDISNLGQQILEFYWSEVKQDTKVFHIDHPEALSRLKALFPENEERITLSRITRALPSLLIQQTGDASLAWLACADSAYRNEPRLHYTMHSTTKIRAAYCNAANTLLRRVGHKPSGFVPEIATEDSAHIGCRFVLALPVLRELVGTLKARLTSRYELNTEHDMNSDGDNVDQAGKSACSDRYRDASSQSALMQYDRDYLLYTFLILTISTGARAVNRPVNLYLQWLANDRPQSGMRSGLSDKDSMFYDKSRLVAVLPLLASQFKNYLLHIEYLMRQLGKSSEWQYSKQSEQLFITFDKKNQVAPLTSNWIKEQFEFHLGAPVPSNFSRAFLRTELLERGVCAETVDAFLGHGNLGESPFSQVSTYDYGHASPALAKVLTILMQDIGLEPIESRLVLYPSRLATR